jgi:hypothetical protein
MPLLVKHVKCHAHDTESMEYGKNSTLLQGLYVSITVWAFWVPDLKQQVALVNLSTDT